MSREKGKAESLVKKYGKIIANIVVDEIIENDCGYLAKDGVLGDDIMIDKDFWIEVRNEIKNYE